MALKINKNIVRENIEDQNGNVIGVIQFDPNDEKIMKKLSDIVRDLTSKVEEQHKIGKIGDLKEINLNSIEEFEENAKNLEKLNKTIDLSYYAIENAINNFTDVFGKETMDAITGGSVSLENLKPLLEFITPYIEEARKKLTDKYLNDKNSTVFE